MKDVWERQDVGIAWGRGLMLDRGGATPWDKAQRREEDGEAGPGAGGQMMTVFERVGFGRLVLQVEFLGGRLRDTVWWAEYSLRCALEGDTHRKKRERNRSRKRKRWSCRAGPGTAVAVADYIFQKWPHQLVSLILHVLTVWWWCSSMES